MTTPPPSFAPSLGPSVSDAAGVVTTTVGVRVDALVSLDAVMGEIALAWVNRRTWLMTFANPATAIAVRRMPMLNAMLRRFDRVGPDGSGMVKAIQWLHRCPATRISFDSTSLAPPVFKLAQAEQIGVVLVGGAPGVAVTAQDEIVARFPGIRMLDCFDGYADQADTIQKIIALQPGIVIVGMGTVLQERFLLALVDAGWQGLGFTCGGYLDQLALKGADYYPAWVDRHNLRFAYRLIMEPGRLWRRYLLEYPEFVVRLCRDLIRRSV